MLGDCIQELFGSERGVIFWIGVFCMVVAREFILELRLHRACANDGCWCGVIYDLVPLPRYPEGLPCRDISDSKYLDLRGVLVLAHG